MSFQTKDLSVIAYANGFTLWHYTTVDETADVDTAGYFDEAADMLRIGDMILANTDTEGTFVSGIYTVSGNDGISVDVADLTQVGATDTD